MSNETAKQLENKVALITGAASGIGRGTALRFAQQGARIVLADVDEDAGLSAQAEIEAAGAKAVFVRCDVSQPQDVERATQTAVEAFGELNIVFANAGINGVWAPLEDLQPDEWDKTFDINLKGTFLTIHFAIGHLRSAGGGSVIITSSVNGNRTFSNAGASAYSASKAGQVALMKMAALELARYNIRVNAVCPGYIVTNIGQRTYARNTDSIRIRMQFPDGRPFLRGGAGSPEEVADVCVFLASEQSRHVTGQEIYVDGGSSLLI